MRAMGQRFSLRKPTTSQERSGKKRRRLAPLEMTVAGGETLWLPGVEEWDVEVGEVGGVAGDEGEVVVEGGGG
jgi:hypothetical protein